MDFSKRVRGILIEISNMKKIIKLGIIALIFLGLANDLFGYTQFGPVYVLPGSSNTSVYSNQIFAYQAVEYDGYFLKCTSTPTLSYVDDGAAIETVFQTADGLHVLYPVKDMIVGLVAKGGFKVNCRAGLIFLNPDLSFNLFSQTTYPARYSISDRRYNDREFSDKLEELSPSLEFK